jgi:hypothetical protein
MNIITGEKIQQLCDVYFGLKEDFDFNPVIKKQIIKLSLKNEYFIDFNKY